MRMMRLLERLWRNRGLDRRLDAELRDHLARDVAARIAAGLDPAEARRRAQLALGGLEQVREACRDVRRPRLLAELGQDLRFALRTIAHQPLSSSAMVLVMALAIGANAAIFSAVDAVALRPLPVPEPDQLALLWKGPLHGEPLSGVAPANAIELRSRLTSASAVPLALNAFTVRTAADSEKVGGMRIAPAFFRTLGVTPATGRALVDADDNRGAEPVAVIGHAFATRRFGDPAAALDQPLDAGGARYRIVGVMPADFSFPQTFGLAFRPEVWVPLRFSPEEAATRGAGYMFLLLRRASDRDWPIVQEELDVVTREYAALEPRVYGGQRLTAIPLQEQVTGPLRPLLFSLWAAVSCVLLLACANVANLLLSRAAVRQRELAVRASLGATRARLLRQLVTESLALTALASIVGWLLALVLVRAGAALLADALPRAGEIALDLRVAAFTAGLALVTTVLAGALPAWRLSAMGPEEVLRATTRGQTSGIWSSTMGRALLVAQIGIAVFLAACAGLLGRSFAEVQRADIGIRPNGLFSFAIARPDADDSRDAAAAFYERLVDRLREIPGITAAGAISALPLDGQDFSWTYEVRDKPAPPGTALEKADVRFVSADALPALGVALRQGRWFARTDQRGSEPVALVSESFARRTWPGANPLDRHVKLAGPLHALPWMRVVGVVADVRFEAVDRDAAPTIYRPSAQHGWKHLTLVTRTDSSPETILPAVRAALREINPDAAMLDPRGFTWYLEKSMARRRLVTLLVSSFAIVGIVLALVGVHALFACMMALRTREMGIRLALGAEASAVVWMVMRQALALCGLGLLLGIGAALGARQVLERFVFGVSASDAPTLVLVSACVLAAAMVASYLPARRAASIELTTALRPD